MEIFLYNILKSKYLKFNKLIYITQNQIINKYFIIIIFIIMIKIFY